MASVLSIAFLLTAFGWHAALGMDCTLGQSENIVEKFIQTCPRPLIDGRDESYCCWAPTGKAEDLRCCTLSSFIFNSISLTLPLIIICVLLSFVISIVCCLCCCCVKKTGGRVLRPAPAMGPYAMPPSRPYQPLPDGRGFNHA